MKCAILLCLSLISAKEEFCPKQCDCDMQGDLKRAVCENQNIGSIDIGVPKHVQVYNLHDNAISELDNYCFMSSGYTSLKFINLSNNRIFWIGLRAFTALDDLLHLDLSNNRLRSIPAELFWDNPLLEYLDLSGNVFETFKNEPFLMHSSLKVLNLHNCRIAAIPLRAFTRLPNLRKLDLSDNYMIGLQIPSLAPMKRLELLQIRNEYLKCTPEFLKVEAWISEHGIDCSRQCKKVLPKMSEKMIQLTPEEKEEVDIRKVWNITEPKVNTSIHSIPVKTETNLTMFETASNNFPSFWAGMMGFEIGLVLGVVGTYIWLSNICTCGTIRCSRPESPRRRRRFRRENELRVNLLWNAALNTNVDTPPSHRRCIELPDGYPSRVFRTRPTEEPERSETPPPPYAECRTSWVFNAGT